MILCILDEKEDVLKIVLWYVYFLEYIFIYEYCFSKDEYRKKVERFEDFVVDVIEECNLE